MDGSRFDDFAKRIGRSTSRRGVLKSFGAVTASALASVALGGGVEAKACRKGSSVCTSDGNCCSGLCQSADETGRRRCACDSGLSGCSGKCLDLANDPKNCGACGNRCPASPCGSATCSAGVCGVAPSAAKNGRNCNDGNACTANDVCNNGVCAGTPITCGQCETCQAGACVAAANGAPCNDGDACSTDDHCENGVCVGGPVDCPDCQTCSGGTCVAATNGATCDDGNACTTNDRCQSGVCRGDAIACGSCQVCSGGACVQNPEKAVDGGACDANGGCCSGTCCNGICCPRGQNCLGGICQSYCLELNQVCDPDTETCCTNDFAETICDANANCARSGESRCCVDQGGSCSSICDCCAPNACYNGFCCPGPGSQCNTSDDCCDGLACDGNICVANCLPADTLCDLSNPTCCQDELTICSSTANCLTTDGVSRCCHPVGGTCSGACECCGGAGCEGGECCTLPGNTCASSLECCGNGRCEESECCRWEGEACSADSECCSAMTCRGGSCQFSCPLGYFSCGSTCCRSDQFCESSVCQGCLPLQTVCDPADNRCCWDETTLCDQLGHVVGKPQCCHPIGGSCQDDGDCCGNVLNRCAGDGVCGGYFAACGSQDECVDGFYCTGYCQQAEPGQPLRKCSTDDDCQSGEGFCSQRFCRFTP